MKASPGLGASSAAPDPQELELRAGGPKLSMDVSKLDRREDFYTLE